MSDQRHDRRVKLMQDLFACTFTPENTRICLEEKPADSTVIAIINNLEDIDERIRLAAPERPLSEINKVDLAILRLIVHESDSKKTPKKVLLNEAIELAKYYSAENSPGFVNGVLAKIILDPETEETLEESV
ncbi:MAG: N utilization substance protein B [Patescibacteria group bacterium]|nr:MAG: N utilization substance protein B [Patescibacteria group bacterium]